MSTPNFYNQQNFKLYIKSFEPMTEEEYEAEDFEYYDSYEEAMEAEREIFYEDIFEGYDGFNELMEKFNDTLIFHKLELRGGYYDGVQLYVEEKDDPNELDNDDCRYYYDMCRSQAIRKYEAEIRKINKWMDKVATQYGWEELICLGIFSNGEAVYAYAERVRDSVKAVHTEN